MKRTTAFVLAAMFVLPPLTVFAADSKTPPDMPKAPNNVPAPVVPAPGMMGRTIVATSDGGIVIMNGNKVSKLDKNLNVTKTIELSND